MISARGEIARTTQPQIHRALAGFGQPEFGRLPIGHGGTARLDVLIKRPRELALDALGGGHGGRRAGHRLYCLPERVRVCQFDAGEGNDRQKTISPDPEKRCSSKLKRRVEPCRGSEIQERQSHTSEPHQHTGGAQKEQDDAGCADGCTAGLTEQKIAVQVHDPIDPAGLHHSEDAAGGCVGDDTLCAPTVLAARFDLKYVRSRRITRKLHSRMWESGRNCATVCAASFRLIRLVVFPAAALLGRAARSM